MEIEKKKTSKGIILVFFCTLVCFVLFEWTPTQRKEVGIPLGILPHIQDITNIPTSLGQVNPNTAAAGNQT